MTGVESFKYRLKKSGAWTTPVEIKELTNRAPQIQCNEALVTVSSLADVITIEVTPLPESSDHPKLEVKSDPDYHLSGQLTILSSHFDPQGNAYNRTLTEQQSV